MLALAGASICAGCAGVNRSPWDALDAAATEPQVFFPGQVSDPATQQWVFSFTPDGGRLFFATDAPRRIMTQSWSGRQWRPAQPVDDPDADRDGGPFVTADGDFLYFSSWRDGRSRDLYRRSLNPEREPERVTFTDAYGEVSLSLDRSGRGFLWTSGRADGTAGIGFYQVLAVGGRVQLLADASGLHSGDTSGENTPYTDPRGRYVLFANYDIVSDTREDLFVSVIRNGRPQAPEPLGDAVNSPFNDTAPWVTPDGRFLLFASDRPVTGGPATGDYQIWYIPVSAVPPLARALGR